MKIHAYSICWNEEVLLPFYLRHYEQFCEKIIIYDNMSTDKSRYIINNHPLCELRDFNTHNEINENIFLEIKNNCWKECRNKGIDYVIVSDIDEFLHSKNLISFLKNNKKFSVFRPAGFEMFANKFQQNEYQLYDQIKKGLFSSKFCKKIIFSPDRIREINFKPGAHSNRKILFNHEFKLFNFLINQNVSKSVRKVIFKFFSPLWYFDRKPAEESELKLLHFKYIDKEYLMKRHEIYSKRLSQINKENKWGYNYLNYKKELDTIYLTLNIKSKKIPEL